MMTDDMNKAKNYRPGAWKPGQSGNLNGRGSGVGKKNYFTDALIQRLDDFPEVTNDIIDAMLNSAMSGGRTGAYVADLLWSRLEGPVVAKMAEQTNTGVGVVVVMPSNDREDYPSQDDELAINHNNNGNGSQPQ